MAESAPLTDEDRRVNSNNANHSTEHTIQNHGIEHHCTFVACVHHGCDVLRRRKRAAPGCRMMVHVCHWLHGSDSQRLSTTHGESSGRDRWTKHGNRTRRAVIGRWALSRPRQRMHRIREVSSCRIEGRHHTQASDNARTGAHPPPSSPKPSRPSAARWTKFILRALPGVLLISCLPPTFYSPLPPCLHSSIVVILQFVCLYTRLIILPLLFLSDLIAGTARSTLPHQLWFRPP